MLDLAARLAREEAEADAREFIIGASNNGLNLRSLAAGVVGYALLKGLK
jgi:hypothetical protein